MTITVQENKYLDHGCIGMDINWDHLALSELDADGNRLGGKIIPLPLDGKSSGQITNIIGRAIQEVFRYCIDKQKALVMEDIDLVIKRHQLKYSSRTGNRHISLVSYAKIGACVQNQMLRTGIPAYMVDPAYTSQIGKFLFMRKYGISIHSAASYAIGLKGLGKTSLLMPDERILRLVPIKEGEKNPFNAIWRNITAAFSKVPKHRFYGQIPYEVLTRKERPTLRTLANAMAM